MIYSRKYSRSIGVWSIVAIALLTSTYSLADKVVLTDGDTLEGIVTKQGLFSVILEHTDLGRTEIPKDRIKSITIDTPEVEVVLIDGDTIQGKLIKDDESGIVLQHPDLGKIEIQREQIAATTIAGPDATVKLAEGDTIKGKLIERSESSIVLEHANLGRIEIPRERIDSLKIKEPELKKEENAGLLDPQLRKLGAKASRAKEKGWQASLDFSLNTATGNTDEQSLRVGSHLQRTLPNLKSKVDFSFYRKVQDGDRTDNKLTLGLGRDWLDPESVWFWFLQGRLDSDDFESWEQRANAQIGPGYHLIQNDQFVLDARLGLGPRREWGSQNDTLKLEALFGGDFEWHINRKQAFSISPYFFPVVGDLDDYRARVTGEWRFLFDSQIRLSFVTGGLYEYQSIADEGKKNGDLRLYMGLRFGF
jgi:hypothetical protein